MSCQILLEFHGENPELTKTLFRAAHGDVRTAVRGKTPGAQKDAGTFQWSSAVRALAVLLAKAAITTQRDEEPSSALLSGFAGSLAATLDYAVSKEPAWTVDIFGIDSGGRSLIRRIIKRTNSERKLPGPVVLAVNPNFLPPETIVLWWNGARLKDPTKINTLINLIELQADLARGAESSSTAELFLPDQARAA